MLLESLDARYGSRQAQDDDTQKRYERLVTKLHDLRRLSSERSAAVVHVERLATPVRAALGRAKHTEAAGRDDVFSVAIDEAEDALDAMLRILRNPAFR